MLIDLQATPMKSLWPDRDHQPPDFIGLLHHAAYKTLPKNQQDAPDPNNPLNKEETTVKNKKGRTKGSRN